MAVYYKFKSAKDFDSIPIDGHFISVANLKEKIFESKHLGRGTDFDLMVSNAQTNEEYADEAMLISKNTSVLVRRVPGRPRMPIVTESEEPEGIENKVEFLLKDGHTGVEVSASRFPEEPEWDEFGNDLYSISEVLPTQPGSLSQDAPLPSKADEDSKIKALIDTSALDWHQQTQEPFGAGRSFGRGIGGRMMGGRGFGRGGLERKTPPQGYVCHRCKVPGHFIQHCPTNGDPNYDIKRVKPPTGIPKSMLMATPDGSYALPSGVAAVLKPNEAAFEKEIEGLPTTRPVNDLPPELRCPLCKEVMKDAVLTSKCCFESFCDRCIRGYIITKSRCVCGATNILADDLLPNKTVRETINRIMESTTSSAENAVNHLHVPDMESVRDPPRKAPSPTLSATAKEGSISDLGKDNSLSATEPRNEQMNATITQQSVEKGKTGKLCDASEATLGSVSVKEPASQGSAPLAEEEVQQRLSTGELGRRKKKKKVRAPANVAAADLQWRGQDFVAENYALSLGPSSYNPYWSGGMQWGMDGYMGPYVGAVPYIGYNPGSFDISSGGIMPQDPFAGLGYGMMPAVRPQRDFMEIGMGSMLVSPPPVSRRACEPQKTNLRKQDMERGERDLPKSKVHIKEKISVAEVSSLKSKPKMMLQSSNVKRELEKRSGSSCISDKPKGSNGKASPRPSKRKGSPDVDGAVLSPDRDRKLRSSVFSRISFPVSGSGHGKRRKSEAVLSNGLLEHESLARSNGSCHVEEWKTSKAGATRKRNVHDQVSSDDDRHFKRRLLLRNGSREEDSQRLKGVREREREREVKRR